VPAYVLRRVFVQGKFTIIYYYVKPSTVHYLEHFVLI